jgi:phosphoribosylamine--glycine ligase
VEGKLSSRKVTFADEATVVKYVVPEGYGTSSVLSGRLIRIDERAVEKEGVKVIYASVNEENGKLYTTTSRSVALFARGPDLYELSSRIESAMQHVSGPVYYRRDIARRDMIEAKIKKMKELLGEAF